MPQKKITDIKISFKQLLQSLKFAYGVDPKSFIIKGITKILQIPFPIAQAYLAKLIMDQISLGIKTEATDTLLIYQYLAIELILLIGQSIITYYQSKIDHIYRQKIWISYEKNVFQKMQRISYETLENYKSQNMSHEVLSKAYNIEQVISNLFSIIQGVSIISSFLGLLFVISPLIAILIFIITLITFVIDKKNSTKNILLYKKLIPTDRFKNFLKNYLSLPYFLKEAKSLNIEGDLFDEYEKASDKTFKENLLLKEKNELNKSILSNISNLCYYLSYAWVIWLSINQKITLGDLTMFVIVFHKIQNGLNQIFSSFITFLEEGEKIKTFFNFLEIPEINSAGVSDEHFKSILNNPIIEFKNVYFSYGEKEVLNDISFKINPKTKIALVGENGSGKSTIIKLLCGLYTPSQGSILIGNTDINKLSRKQIKTLMGVVFQDFVKFPFSFKENITIAEKESTRAEYDSSLQFSGADKIKEGLTQGDDQKLHRDLFEDGVDLSGGQWQKIAISRAFIQKGNILILDEPTSAVDAKQEYEIFKKFQELTKDKTSILVSHRFSTVRIAERILFLEDGKVIEEGSHQELLDLNGKYAQMFHLQAEGYR